MEPPPTLEGLVKEVRISLALLDQRCTDDHLKSISLFLDWRRVAPHLGLSERDIQDVKFEKRTESEKRLGVLQKWKTKYSYMATFKNLVEALLTVQNADDAERVCRLLQTHADTGAATSVEQQQNSLEIVTAEPTKKLPGPVVEVPNSPVQPLEGEIEKEIEELEDQFLDVVDEAAKSLENIQLSKIKRSVTQLRVSVKYQHIKFLEQKLEAINSAQSVDAIFAILGLYWDFLNCGLLYEVIRKLGNDRTKLLMEQYMEKLRRFRMKTKLGDFVDKWAHSIPHFTTFITEMGENWRDRTLEDLEDFRKELAKSMYLKEYAMHFKSAGTGSITITWALQSTLPAISDILQSAFQLLEKKYCILRVIFQGKCIPEPKSLESPPSATPSVPLSLPTPLGRSELETNTFDMITELLSAGVPHIAEQILQSLDVKSLVVSEQVSSTWRDIIGDLRIWKHMIKHKIDSNHLWRGLFKKRGWHKYLDMPPAEQMSRQLYRQLHHSASKDIHSLEENWRRGHYTLTTIETDTQVACLQCDDNKIVTGHRDSTIKIRDRSTLQVVNVLKGHRKVVLCLQYNKEVIISGSRDSTVKVWDIQTSQVINDLLHHKKAVISLKFTTDTLVTGSDDKTVAVWNFKSPSDITLKMILKGHQRSVFAVDLSETNIISGSEDKTIKVWDAFTGELVRTLHGHTHWVKCLQLQGNQLISGSHDATIRIWNIDTGECIRVLHGHDEWVFCVAVDNKRILSGSYDKTIKVWDMTAALDTGSSSNTLCIATLEVHTHSVKGVQFDEFQVISGSYGALLKHDFLDPTPPF